MMPISKVTRVGGFNLSTLGSSILGNQQKGLDPLLKPLFANGEQGFYYEPNPKIKNGWRVNQLPNSTDFTQSANGFTAVQEADGWLLTSVTGSSGGYNLFGSVYPMGASTTNFNGGTIVRSVEIKKGSAGVLRYGAAGDGGALFIDLATMTVSRNAGNLPYTITPLEGAWYRLEFFQYAITFGVVSLSQYFGWANSKLTAILDTTDQVGTTIYARKPSFAYVPYESTKPIPYQEITNNVELFNSLHSDITMFQTSTAATPVMASNQPVGMILDRSKGLVLGEERIVNGDFSNGETGWVTQGLDATHKLTFSEGQVRYESGAITPVLALTQANILEVGKWYVITLTISKATSGTLKSDSLGGLVFPATVGTHRLRAKASSPTFGITRNSANVDITIDSISVKESAGNHAIQATSSLRPLYIENPKRLSFDGIDDKFVTTLPSELTNCTVLRSVPNVGTKVLYNQTLPATYTDVLDHSGLLAINRALSRTEQIKLMEELDKNAGAIGFETEVFKIFDNDQAGFVYDINDLETMYQDSTGKMPVTAADQPVGLILDKRKGSHVGLNLHTPATPINNTSYPATGTRSGLDITVSNDTAGYAAISVGMSTVVGKDYLIDLTAPSTSGFWVLISDSATSDTANRRTAVSSSSAVNTKISFVFTASATTTYIHLNRGSSQTLPATFKDVSVREITGNSAFQTTSAARPILRKNATTGAYYLEFDSIDDYLQVARTALPSPVTSMFAVDDSGGSYSVLLSSGNVGYYNLTANGVGINAGSSITRNAPKDVVSFKAINGNINIKSSTGEASVTYANNFASMATKYIGLYTPTGTIKFNGNIYGIVVITKELSTAEELGFRQLFNKRLGV